MRITDIMLILAAGLVIAGCDKSESSKSGRAPGLRFAVIPKGMTHEHWKAVEAGAKKAAAEVGNVEIIYKSAPKEDDTQLQINLVESFVSSRVDGIILAPLSDQALVRPVRLAAQAKIPVIIFDSALVGEVGKDFVCYIGTDNYRAGTLAGRRLGEVMEGKGTVLLLRYAESSASTREREQGFLDALKKDFADIAVIDPPQYAGADVNSGKKAAENMITAHLGKFDGVFCPNETSAAGMLIALEDRQLAGKVRFVGFDANPRVIAGLRDRKLDGVVLQDPFKMGYQSVRQMLDHLAGKPVPPSTDTGAAVATPENVDSPEIYRLLHPLEAAASQGS
ncbi:MAG: substrate-binding domain-containing protein [Phycisphaerae bacterium]